MSQRYLIPTNLYFRQNDPYPPEFPEPHTGDIYFNTVSKTIRVFYEGGWNDAGSGGGSSLGEVAIQPTAPEDSSVELWMDTSS